MNELNNETKEGSNIFILDGAIGRLRFFLTSLAIVLYNLLAGTIAATYASQGINIDIFLYLGLSGTFCILIPFYLLAICFIKRIYDLIGDKTKAIFYYFLYLIAATSLTLLAKLISPIFDIIAIITVFPVAFFLLFKKGKIINPSQIKKS